METIPFMIRDGKASMIGKQPFPLSWVSAIDLARMVVTSLNEPKTFNNKFYDHGTEKYLMNEALEKYVKEIRPEIKKIYVLPMLIAKIDSKCSRNKELAYAVNLFGYFEKIKEMGHAKMTNQIFGKPEITLNIFISSQKAKSILQ